MAFHIDVPVGFVVERLDSKTHDRAGFSCGSPELDVFLKTQAQQAQDKDTSATHVVVLQAEVESKPRSVVGFVTLVLTTINVSERPTRILKKAGAPTIPGLLLARMAVASTYKGRGLGAFLIKFAFKNACEISESAGCAAIVVDAKDDDLAKYYQRFGFELSPSRPRRSYIATASVKQLFNK